MAQPWCSAVFDRGIYISGVPEGKEGLKVQLTHHCAVLPLDDQFFLQCLSCSLESEKVEISSFFQATKEAFKESLSYYSQQKYPVIF